MNRLVALGLACLTGLALVAPLAPGTAAAADLALVIGNHDYRQAPDARSARVDAEAVAEALEQGGYEVISGTNLNRNDMRRGIARFADRVGEADRAVVFYSGHALRSGGVTYLAPVDQGNASLVEVMMDGVPLDLVLRVAAEASGRAVVFVDGAQLDGFTPKAFAEPGIAEIDSPEGVLVVSAAAPGRAIVRRSERQSEFARQVVERFLAPGNRIGSAVRGLGGPTWVGGDTHASLVLVPSGRGQASDRTGSGTRAASASEVEAQLGLTARERRRLQESLNRLGYDTRGTDGIFGRGTRSAIRGWQRANDFPATGYLTAEQVSRLNRQRSGQGTETGTDTGTDTGGRTAAEVEARLNLSASERSEIQEQLTSLGYDTRGTSGAFGSGTRTAIRNWQRANDLEETGYLTQAQVARLDRQVRAAEADTGGRTAAEVEARLNLSAAERSEIQERLTNLGYDTRGTGGVFGSGTRTAIRNWQRANNLEETGYLTGEQVSMLDRQAREAGTGTGGRTAADVEARLDLSAAERRDIQARLTDLGYDTRGTDGVFGSGTRTAIRNWQRAVGLEETGYLTQEQVSMIYQGTGRADRTSPDRDPAAVEDSLGLTRNDRLSIEQRLAHLGFPPGEQDGFFDGNTRQAIESYQRNRGYRPTGYLDRDTVSGIVEETRGVRTGIVGGAQILMDLLRGLGDQQ